MGIFRRIAPTRLHPHWLRHGGSHVRRNPEPAPRSSQSNRPLSRRSRCNRTHLPHQSPLRPPARRTPPLSRKRPANRPPLQNSHWLCLWRFWPPLPDPRDPDFCRNRRLDSRQPMHVRICTRWRNPWLQTLAQSQHTSRRPPLGRHPVHTGRLPPRPNLLRLLRGLQLLHGRRNHLPLNILRPAHPHLRRAPPQTPEKRPLLPRRLWLHHQRLDDMLDHTCHCAVLHACFAACDSVGYELCECGVCGVCDD